MKKWLKISLWSFFVIGLLVLGYFINEARKSTLLPAPEIVVHVDDENAFITNDELLEMLKLEGLIFNGQTIEQLNVEKIEAFIANISQVRAVEVFQQIDGYWKIDVELKKPIARIYNLFGESYYLDNEGSTLETRSTYTARVLVATGQIPDRSNSLPVDQIINNDSLKSIQKLDEIYRISNYVCNDPLFHSLIGQLHLKKNGDFVLIPLVGDQKIIFGSAYSEKEVANKFNKLKIFYEEAMPYEGWNTYSEISLKFDDQVVCKKKNTNE